MKTSRIVVLMFMMVCLLPIWGQGVVIDIRQGLSESRVRQIKQMPDGRIAIATTNTIDIFDGVHFTSYELSPNSVYPLPDYHGERQLTCDSLGYVWLRYKRRLYVLDTRRGEVVADVGGLMKRLGLTDSQLVAWPQDTIPSEIMADDITAYVCDSYGGIWIGTFERGILYSNPKRLHQFTNYPDSDFVFARQPDYRTPHASLLAARYAAGITNCALDLGGDYVYIGTRKGLMIFNSSNQLLATLDERDGLPSLNVQAMIDDSRGDVWVATTTGLSRLHVISRDSFSIKSYGILDGINLDGGEFRTGQMHNNEDGSITVGYAKGIIVFHPDSVTAPCYTFYYPRPQSVQEEQSSGNTLWIWLASAFAVVLLVLAALYWWRRWVLQSIVQAKTCHARVELSNETIERLKGTPADEQFLKRLKEITEENISNEDFSVQTLSELMAMDRTGLYRRMQNLTNMSPSDYIKNVRMEVAARLLRETSLPVSDIAVKTGFSSTKYFSKVFKEHFNVSPREYKETTLNNSG